MKTNKKIELAGYDVGGAEFSKADLLGAEFDSADPLIILLKDISEKLIKGKRNKN